MFSHAQYAQAQSLIDDHLRSVSDLAVLQRDFVNAALANSTVFSRQMCNALNGTGVLFVEATEQIQGLFNRVPNKSLK
ncbi:hypothetical protein ASD15_20865 [Massilia sp. Root351]|uniref:hypothetical protein n=1 Tax=Massilia sp. Root351 TaxID=1736522 RepID=UPI0007111C2E|nr:hypothetical protein [Massilia sp. Root351]KQV79115.1 hypothetical protein ASD15_20865 [Massilia sp. Root351]